MPPLPTPAGRRGSPPLAGTSARRKPGRRSRSTGRPTRICGNSKSSASPRIFAGRTSVARSDAETCVKSFGRIINQSSLQGISAALNDADWEATHKSERFPDKYHACVSMLFNVLDEHVGLEFPGDIVEVILDTDRAPDDALNALLKEWGTESPIIASIAFGRRSQFPVLECADLCAGTERTSQIAGGWFGGNLKNSWNQISHAKSHRSSFWSLETARRSRKPSKSARNENGGCATRGARLVSSPCASGSGARLPLLIEIG